MLNKIRIWWLKRRARNIHYQLETLFEEYDCGDKLADYVSGGRLTALRQKYLDTVDERRGK